MSREFVATVTISMTEYTELKRIYQDHERLSEIRNLLQSVVTFPFGTGSRQDFDRKILEISRFLNRSIWDKKGE